MIKWHDKEKHEKVIKALELLTYTIPYNPCVEDAIELLKEQEPLPITTVNYNESIRLFACSRCKTHLSFGQRYCHMCGRAAKWNE